MFGAQLGDVRAALREGLHAAAGDASTDLYLVGSRIDRSVKIRRDALEMKVRVELRGELERWAPQMRISFPVAVERIRDPLSEALGVALPTATDEHWTRDALLRLLDARAGVTAVAVEKHRERFADEAVRAEFVAARIAGDPIETVAVEGVDAGAVLDWVRRLALDRWPNTSYVRWLRRAREKQGSAAWGERSSGSSC